LFAIRIMPSALDDGQVSGENGVGNDTHEGAQSSFRYPLASVKQPCDKQRHQAFKPETHPPHTSSVVRTLRDENARLADEVRALEEELHHLWRNANGSPKSTIKRDRPRPPRSSSLQLRRRSSDDYDEDVDDKSYELLVHERGVRVLGAQSWHPPARRQAIATATNLPHDVESHQSSQGLHHRRAAAVGTGAHAGPVLSASLNAATPARARPLAVTGGGAPDEGDGGDDDDYFIHSSSAGEASSHQQAPPPSTFCARVQDRAGWLVGLLVLQSMSSFIISRNEALLQSHLVIVQFLTMLVGAGGNAGNQASVRGEWRADNAEVRAARPCPLVTSPVS
jgi:hypothetical protein